MKTKPSKLLKRHFDQLPRRIFWPLEMSEFLSEHRHELNMPTIGIAELLEILLEQKLVIRAEFTSHNNKYDPIVRYVRGQHSSVELALSLQRNSFLSHGTALTIHGMAAPEKIIYVNREQSPKDRPDKITQAGINLAFRNKQRQSKYVFTHATTKYVLLNGKHTDRAGVIRAKATSGETLDVTDKERTLIDAIVRPAYAGGIERVAEAYARGVNRIDVDHMIDLLHRLDHAYPYHQAIGFLLERAGRAPADCDKFETLGKEFEFHLDYAIRRPAFNKKWRLHYPAALD